jgi:hypothetical protein
VKKALKNISMGDCDRQFVKILLIRIFIRVEEAFIFGFRLVNFEFDFFFRIAFLEADNTFYRNLQIKENKKSFVLIKFCRMRGG